MLRDFPHWSEQARSAGCEWAFFAPETHPLLQQQPGWYMLHPCQTPQFMELLLDKEEPSQQEGMPSAADEDIPLTVPELVPDMDESLAMRLLPETSGGADPSSRQQVPAAACWMVPEDAPDELLLRYMEAWIIVAGPVVGLRLAMKET